jgi:beta-lactamase superfamily II metal-dependent hydrolase
MRWFAVTSGVVGWLFVATSQLQAADMARGLDVYWIDVEGGAATLIVTPVGETVLIDSGNPGLRDVNRIVQVVTRQAGQRRIDHLITTHYHRDHFGGAAGLASALPIGEVHDNGVFDGQRETADPEYYRFKVDKRSVIAPGDRIALRELPNGSPPLSLRCLGARQKFMATTDDKANACCQANQPRPVDNSDNANSVVMQLSYGQFDLLDTGDLTWNREFDLVCPVNRVGVVDVFQVSHHGLDVSNNPVLIRSIEPTVAVFNNSPTKGCTPGAFAALKETPSVEAIYQMHKNLRPDGATTNTPDELIANLTADCRGEPLRLSVAADGKTFTLFVTSSGHQRTYPSK